MLLTQEAVFPRLDDHEMECVRRVATPKSLADGEILFHAGTAEIPFNVVESGGLEIINPLDEGRIVVTHGPGHFSGDIDMLTGRPVNVGARAAGETLVLQLPHDEFRHLLNRVPSLGEKLMWAFTLAASC